MLLDLGGEVATVDTLAVEEADALLGLWRGNPEALYPFIPSTEWRPLSRARQRLAEMLSTWGSADLNGLSNLENYCSLFPAETSGLAPALPPRRKRILIVDDDPELTDMLVDLLHDHLCVIARTLGDAIDVVSDTSTPLDGALVDLHLTKHLDSSGFAILSALQSLRPDVPRVLLTSSPPADGMHEVSRAYGLFEVLVKDGANAPVRTRSTIDTMLGTSPESALRRVKATFESTAANAEKAIRDAIVRVRKRERRGELIVDGQKDRLLDELAALSDDIDSTRQALATAQPTPAADLFEEFAGRWSSRTESSDATH